MTQVWCSEGSVAKRFRKDLNNFKVVQYKKLALTYSYNLVSSMTLFLGDLKREELCGKTVFVRVDYNVPLKKDDASNTMQLADTSRVRASLPSLEFLLQNGAKVVLCSHLDRPRGPDPSLSLRLLVEPLQEMVKEFSASVIFVDECIGTKVDKAKQELRAGEILLLENLRFHSDEMSNDPTFSEHLASHIDIYVNDAFGAAHRGIGVVQLKSLCFSFSVLFPCNDTLL